MAGDRRFSCTSTSSSEQMLPPQASTGMDLLRLTLWRSTPKTVYSAFTYTYMHLIKCVHTHSKLGAVGWINSVIYSITYTYTYIVKFYSDGLKVQLSFCCLWKIHPSYRVSLVLIDGNMNLEYDTTTRPIVRFCIN